MLYYTILYYTIPYYSIKSHNLRHGSQNSLTQLLRPERDRPAILAAVGGRFFLGGPTHLLPKSSLKCGAVVRFGALRQSEGYTRMVICICIGVCVCMCMYMYTFIYIENLSGLGVRVVWKRFTARPHDARDRRVRIELQYHVYSDRYLYINRQQYLAYLRSVFNTHTTNTHAHMITRW